MLVLSLFKLIFALNRGSYMSAHVLLNLLNELRKRDNMRLAKYFISFFATSLMNSITQEHQCWIKFITCHLKFFKNGISGVKIQVIIIFTQRIMDSLRNVSKSVNHWWFINFIACVISLQGISVIPESCIV